MIHFLLLQNRQGQTRLSRWYVPVKAEEKGKIESEVHRMITSRPSKFSNFINTEKYKIVYRRYAGLFFSVAVDLNANELTYLELIHLFVESMDIYFGNVCELDIVFNFQKVYMLLDEVILGGEILETSKRAIRDKMVRMDEIMEKEQVSFVSRLFGADT
eukprot:g3634.t1